MSQASKMGSEEVETLNSANEESDEDSSEEEDFFANLTSDQLAKIRAKQKKLQTAYKQFEEVSKDEKADEVAKFFSLTRTQAETALSFFENDEMETKQALLENEGLLDSLKSTGEISTSVRKRRPSKSNLDPSRPTTALPDTIRIIIGSNNGEQTPANDKETNEELLKLIKAEEQKKREVKKQLKVAKGCRYDGTKRAQNLRLTQALDNAGVQLTTPDERKAAELAVSNGEGVIVDEKMYYKKDLIASGWSEARIKSFMSINTNPNSYYYRFNHPGEEHKTGNWTDAECEQFMQKLKDDNGTNYRWGEFSIEFVGRVGYQCSNFYRKLIQEKQITDPNYVEIDGKLKFLGRDGKKFTRKKEEEERKVRAQQERELRKTRKLVEGASAGSSKKKRKSKSRKKVKLDEFGMEISDNSESEAEDLDNNGVELIPGLECPMTCRTVKNPTLSPYGHIMGYNTWIKILSKHPRNTCPFTNQKLTRRSLVKLDVNNIKDHVQEIKKIKPDFNLEQILSQG